MGMRDVMQALSEGAGRQSAIGGLMFQDAQLREGRTYEEAMAKERERRANLEWGRRHEMQAETAETAAEKLLTGQKEVSQMGIDAAERDAARARTHAEYLARLREARAGQRQKDLIEGHADAAKLLADAKLLEREEDNELAVEAARIKLVGEKAKGLFDAKVDRAKEAEDHLSKLYEGLDAANVEWSEEEQRWVSGGQYMEQIFRAQERVEAAWNATGVASLMKERNVNAIRLGYFEQGVVARVSMELKPQQWKDVVNGLQSEKDSGDYKAALETIRPYIENAIEASRIRVTAGEREKIRDAVIERISTYKEELDDPKTEEPPPVTSGDLGSSLLGPDKIDNIEVDITVADIGTVASLREQIEASPVTGTGPRGVGKAKHPLAGDLQTAMKRDPEYLLPLLIQEREKILENQEYYGKKPYEKRLEKIEALIQKFEGLLGEPQASAGDLGDGDIEGMEDQAAGMQVAQMQPEGLLNQQGGMISRADELSYAPEDVNARWA